MAATPYRGLTEGPALPRVCLVALALRLILFLGPGLRDLTSVLERRPELSTPVGSFRAFKEAVHLDWLHSSSHGQLPKPYASGTLHLPPIMLALTRLWQPLTSRNGRISDSVMEIATAVAWSVADVAAAILLASIYTRKQSLAKQERRAKSSASSQAPNVDGVVYAGSIIASPGGVAACYLFNPFTIASCLARSTGPFNNLAVLFAVNASLSASSFFLATGLALAVLVSLYPVLLLPALAVLCAKARRAHTQRHRGFKENNISAASLALPTLLFSVMLAAGTYISYQLAGCDFSFLDRAYGTLLLVPDLTPNIGLWWYFFIEIFDHFRDFFLLAFNVHAACYTLPLTIKYHQDPLFAVTALSGLMAVLKSYPTLSDASLFLALLSMHTEILPYLRHPFVTTLLYAVSALLMPALHHVWLSAGSGNANFFYASTLVWAIGSGAAVLDAMWAWGRWRWEAERPVSAITDMISEKQAQATDQGAKRQTVPVVFRRVVQV